MRPGDYWLVSFWAQGISRGPCTALLQRPLQPPFPWVAAAARVPGPFLMHQCHVGVPGTWYAGSPRELASRCMNPGLVKTLALCHATGMLHFSAFPRRYEYSQGFIYSQTPYTDNKDRLQGRVGLFTQVRTGSLARGLAATSASFMHSCNVPSSTLCVGVTNTQPPPCWPPHNPVRHTTTTFLSCGSCSLPATHAQLPCNTAAAPKP